MARSTLEAIIAQAKRESFTAEVSDAEALGVAIAQHFQWGGEDIIEAFQSALEDSNFHSFNRDIDELKVKHELEGPSFS